jgi:hypothetical protein
MKKLLTDLLRYLFSTLLINLLLAKKSAKLRDRLVSPSEKFEMFRGEVSFWRATPSALPVDDASARWLLQLIQELNVTFGHASTRCDNGRVSKEWSGRLDRRRAARDGFSRA